MRLLAQIGSLVAVLGFPALAQAQILGVTWTGDVVNVDDITGDGVVLGNGGFDHVNATSQDRNGRIIASAASRGTLIPALIEVDLTGGPATLIHRPFLNDIRALAFSPINDDLLYAVDPNGSGTENRLYTLDLTVPFGDSSIKTLVGTITLGGVQGMTFDQGGTLWAWSIAWGLMTVDEHTCAATDVNGLLDGSSEIQTLCFDPAGKLYGVGERLYVVDQMSGAISPVGMPGLFGSVRGAEYVGPLRELYCFGDGSLTACPCGNEGSSGHGCANSVNSSGALLSLSGTTNPNTLQLTCSGVPNNALCTFLRAGGSNPAGQVFGDGIGCLTGSPLRFGSGAAGQDGNPPQSIATSTAAPLAGGVRFYQCHYRNPNPGFCTPSLFNISNGIRITW